MNIYIIYAIILVALLALELIYLIRFASFLRWLRLPLSRLGIVQASLASALDCTIVRASSIALGLASVRVLRNIPDEAGSLYPE